METKTLTPSFAVRSDYIDQLSASGLQHKLVASWRGPYILRESRTYKYTPPRRDTWKVQGTHSLTTSARETSAKTEHLNWGRMPQKHVHRPAFSETMGFGGPNSKHVQPWPNQRCPMRGEADARLFACGFFSEERKERNLSYHPRHIQHNTLEYIMKLSGLDDQDQKRVQSSLLLCHVLGQVLILRLQGQPTERESSQTQIIFTMDIVFI